MHGFNEYFNIFFFVSPSAPAGAGAAVARAPQRVATSRVTPAPPRARGPRVPGAHSRQPWCLGFGGSSS